MYQIGTLKEITRFGLLYIVIAKVVCLDNLVWALSWLSQCPFLRLSERDIHHHGTVSKQQWILYSLLPSRSSTLTTPAQWMSVLQQKENETLERKCVLQTHTEIWRAGSRLVLFSEFGLENRQRWSLGEQRLWHYDSLFEDFIRKWSNVSFSQSSGNHDCLLIPPNPAEFRWRG